MKRRISMVMAALVVLVGLAYVLPVRQASAASSASLSIVPKKNYVIEPGDSVKDKLTIRNLDPVQPLELNLRVIDFTFTDDGGTPKLMLAADAPQTTWSLKPFLTLPESVTIAPNSSKTIDMSVAIPANHGAGSYYSAILYSSGAPGEGGNVGLSASGVTLVFTSIPGQVNEKLTLEKFGAYVPATATQKADYKFITTDEPQYIAYTLKNDGNVTEAPVGSITLKDMFGKTRTIDEINPNGSLALIGQTRTFTSCIEIEAASVDFNGAVSRSKTCKSPGLWPGYYSVHLDAFYGQNGNQTQEIVKDASFWYLPWWFIAAVIVVLLIAIYFIRKVVLAIRRKFGIQPKPKKPLLRRK
ncbi:MAG TPA: hypothetical protein VF281_03650 [Candidatus Saccharimonadales bacterium]